MKVNTAIGWKSKTQIVIQSISLAHWNPGISAERSVGSNELLGMIGREGIMDFSVDRIRCCRRCRRWGLSMNTTK